jgi:cysteine synthase A
MIVEDLIDFKPLSVFFRVKNFIRDDVELYIKNEMFNPGGSIKFKPAVAIVRALEAAGDLRAGDTIIDTTSGNMGIALSLVARSRGYGFICVSDEKITSHNRKVISAYGAELVILPRSTLRERYTYISARIQSAERLVWTRQFTSEFNPRAHETTTALEIFQEFPNLDYLFVGAGTAGTLSGCSRAIRDRARPVKLVAVDALGSAHFEAGGPPLTRRLPGIGASERSRFLDDVDLHASVIIAEEDAVDACRELVSATGWLMGASTGSVLAAVRRLQERFKPGDQVVAVGVDSGERYLEAVYDAAPGDEAPRLDAKATEVIAGLPPTPKLVLNNS